ncbi:unnamed protein product [Mesocestoides corti]|uniref:Intraflagellar transport protein 43 homolog n=1 Tax=Mesocestoides corti TaxID=53468 RepID=A0A0R3UA75_MESCO|nr:unnamed protein product [Mesocestoides corti]
MEGEEEGAEEEEQLEEAESDTVSAQWKSFSDVPALRN